MRKISAVYWRLAISWSTPNGRKNLCHRCLLNHITYVWIYCFYCTNLVVAIVMQINRHAKANNYLLKQKKKKKYTYIVPYWISDSKTYKTDTVHFCILDNSILGRFVIWYIRSDDKTRLYEAKETRGSTEGNKCLVSDGRAT